MFQVYFSTSNAAFDSDFPNEEIARVLREVANRVNDGDLEGMIRDHNGNQIGEFSSVE